MKHPQKLGQMIFAAVFFCSVIGYGALNLWYAKEPLAENVQEAWDNIREEPAAETVVNAVADLDTAVTETRCSGIRCWNATAGCSWPWESTRKMLLTW